MIDVDWTLKLSDILTIATFVGGGIAVAFNIRSDVRSQGLVVQEMKEEHISALKAIREERAEERAESAKRFASIEKDLKQIADATVAIARQDERLNAMDHRLSSLEDERKLERLAKVAKASAALAQA